MLRDLTFDLSQSFMICLYTYHYWMNNVEVVPKKISDYQVSEKIHSKAGAEENIIMEIPLWPSAAENV